MDVQDLVTLSGWIVALATIGGLVYQRSEIRELRRSNDLLEQQNAILERQIASEQADRDAARSAEIGVVRGGRDGLGYWFELVNVGPAPATDVRAWIAHAANHEEAISPSAEIRGPLLPQQTSERLSVSVPEAMILERWPAVLLVAWRDSEERVLADNRGINW